MKNKGILLKFKLLLSFLLGGVLSSGVVVYAAATIASSDVQYTPSDSTWSVDNVETAISQLRSINGPLMEEMCPGCVYAFPSSSDGWLYGTNGTTLTSAQYKTNWENVITETGKKVFAGLILDGTNKITRAFMCGVKDGVPFCLEGSPSSAKVKGPNLKFANSSALFDGGCYLDGSAYRCNSSSISVNFDAGGSVRDSVTGSFCTIWHSGEVQCG